MVAPTGSPVAIVLAAGKSDRMGANKLLEILDGKTMIERTLATFTQSTRVNDVVLVVPAAEAAQYAWLKSLHVHLVENPAPEKGMISSIRAGLSSTWTHERDFLLHPADVPYVKPEIVDRIVREAAVRGARVVLPTYKGLGGHPGFFASALRQDFFAHGDQNGAREILTRHRSETFRLNVHDPDVCFDVDTPDDLRIAADPGARWARVEQQAEDKKGGRPH